jgi:succinylglutamate desuccinylase
MTPMSASAITTARWAGSAGDEVSPYDVTNRWNRGFVAGQLLLAWAAIALAA